MHHITQKDREEFKQAVFQVVRLIPLGRASSYGAIAKAIGFPNHSRMVGHVLAHSSEEGIPAHRVVNNQGILSAQHAFKTPSTMQNLLEAEGVKINNNRIHNWKDIFWDPMKEL